MMRNIIYQITIVFILIFCANSLKAANRFWVSSGTGNWNSTASWSTTTGGTSGASVPGSGDVAIFDGGGSKVGACTINAAVNVAGFTVSSSYTGTITQSSGNKITIGTSNASFSTGTFVGSSTSTDSIIVNGTFTLAGTSFTSTSGYLVFNNQITNTSGTFTHNSGTVIFAYQSLSYTIPAWNFYSITITGSLGGNSISLAASTIGIANIFNPNVRFTSGGYVNIGNTINFNGSGSQTIPAFNYNNLTSSSSGSRTLASSGTIGIAGVLTPGTNTYTTTGSTINFNGGTQNIPAFTFNNLTCSGTADKTATGALVVNGILTLSRVLTMSTNALSGTLSSTSGGGTLQTANTTSTPIPAGVTWTFGVAYNSASAQSIVSGNYADLNGTGGARTLSSTGTVGIAGAFTVGAGAYTVTGSTVDFNGGTQNIPAFTFNNLTCSGSSDKSATGALVVNGTLTINSLHNLIMSTNALSGTVSSTSGTGTLQTANTTSTPISTGKTWTFDVLYNSASAQTIVNGNYTNLDGTGGARTLSSTGTVGIAGTFTLGAGAYTVTSSTVEFNGAAQNISAFTFNNLTCDGSGDKTATGALVVNGTLTINSGRILSMSTNALSGTISSTSGTGTLQTANTTSTPIPASKTWTMTVEYNGAAQSVVAGTYAGLTCDGSGDKTATAAFAVNGTLTINSGRILDMSTNALSGTITSSGTGTLKTANTTSTPITVGTTWTFDVLYNSASAQTIVNGNYTNLDGTGGARTLNSTGTVGIAGTFTVGAGTYTVTSSTVDFNGASQNIPAFTFNNLTCDGTGDKTATGALTVNGILTISSGRILSMSTNALSGTISSTSGTGKLQTANTTSTPIPASKTWTMTVEYNGAAQSVVGGTYTNLGCTGSGDKTATAAIVVNNTLLINSQRVLTMSTNALSGTLSTVSGTGTLQTANTTSTPIPAGETWTTTVEYNGAAQSVVAATYSNLICDGTGDKTATAAITVNGVLTISSGRILNMSTNALSGTISSTSGTGTLQTANTTSTPIPASITWTNTVEYNGAAQSVVGGTYAGLTCDGSGDKTATAASVVNGTLTINSGRILDMSTFQLSGTVTPSGTGTLKTANTGSTPIPAGITWTYAVLYNSASAQTIINGNYADLNGTNGARTLNATGTVGIAGTFTPGAGAYTVTSSTVDFNGAAQNVPAFTFNNLTCDGSGDKTATGTLTVNGILTIASGRILSMSTNPLSGTISSTSGTGTLQIANTSGTPIPASKTWTMTVEYNGAAQSVVGGTYASLTCDGTGDKTATAAPTVNSTLTISSGRILDMSTFQLSGTLASASGTGTLKTANTGSTPIPVNRSWPFAVLYNSASAQSIVYGFYTDLNGTGGARTLSTAGTTSISGTFTPGAGAYTVTSSAVDFDGATQNVPAFTFNNLTCSGTGDKTATGALVVNGALTINSGRILTMSTNALSGTLSSIAGTGTLQTANTTSTPIPTGKTWTFALAYNSASAQTIVNGNYVDLDGTGGARTLNATGTVGIAGVFTVGAGAYIVTGSTVDFNGATQNVPAFTFNNLTCDGTGDKTATGALVVNGTLTISSGRILTMSTNALSGTLSTISGTGILQTANTTSTPVPAGMTWTFGIAYNSASAQNIVNGNYADLNGTGGARTLSATGTVGIAGAFTVGAGAYTVTGSTINFNGVTQNVPAFTFNNLTCSGTGDKTATGDLTVNGLLTVNSGRILSMSSSKLLSSTITSSGTGTLKTANTFVPAIPTGRTWSFSVEYNGTAAQTVPVGTFTNLTISGAHVTDTVTLASGIIKLSGNYTNSITSGVIKTTADTLLFNGTSYQHIGGTATIKIQNLSVNKSSGKVLLTAPVTIVQKLILTKGVIGTTATNIILIPDNVTSDYGSDTSYVCGPVKKTGNDIFVFPLGDTLVSSGAYHPLGITAPSSTSDAYTGQYFSSNVTAAFPADTVLQTDSLQSISNCEYWLLTRNAGSSTVVPSIGWNSNSCNVTDYQNLRVAGWDGSQWKSLGLTGISVNSFRGIIKPAIGISATAVPLVIAKPKSAGTVYAELRRELDGGCYNILNGNLCFKYNEEYADKDGKLQFNVYNSQHHVIASNTSVPATIEPSDIFGENYVSMNVSNCSFASGSSLGNGIYVLEVINDKNEKWYLRFKQTITISDICTGVGSWGY